MTGISSISKILGAPIIDLNSVRRVMTSNELTEAQKAEFLHKNATQIHHLVTTKITPKEFRAIMKNRRLRKFRFLKNSAVKYGDKIFLAESLGITPSEVAPYIDNVTDSLERGEDLGFLPKGADECIKTYVYRHGKRKQVVAFLDYELSKANDKLKTLYTTLEYNSGGAADYFIRPIHRMDNRTLVDMYNVIHKHLKLCQETGQLSEGQSLEIGEWALRQIYLIQNNSKLINAIKTYRTLNG